MQYVQYPDAKNDAFHAKFELEKSVILVAFLPSPSLLAAAAVRHIALPGTNHTNVKIDLRGKSKDSVSSASVLSEMVPFSHSIAQATPRYRLALFTPDFRTPPSTQANAEPAFPPTNAVLCVVCSQSVMWCQR
jgi:hypothetical protein